MWMNMSCLCFLQLLLTLNFILGFEWTWTSVSNSRLIKRACRYHRGPIRPIHYDSSILLEIQGRAPSSMQKRTITLRDAVEKLQNTRSLSSIELQSYMDLTLRLIEETKPVIADKLYLRLLDISIEHKLPDFAIKVFNNIVDRNIQYSGATVSGVMTLIAKTGDIDAAFEIFSKLASNGYSPTLHNFTPLLRCAGSATRAKQLLQRMELCGVESNAITYTTAIKSLEATADWRSGLELLEWMKCRGVQPNEITYCCILTLTSRDQAGDVAVNILREMLASGISPNALCYGATLVACVKSGMWTEVDELLKEMMDVRLPLLDSVLGSAINACRLPTTFKSSSDFREHNFADDEKLLNNNSSLSDLIAAEWRNIEQERLQSKPDVDLAERAFQLLTKWAHKVVNQTDSLYTMAMDVMESNQEYQKVLEAYTLMRDAGIPASKSSLNFAIRAASQLMDCDFALKLLSDAVEQGLDHCNLYNATMIICDKRGRHADAISVLLSLFATSNTSNVLKKDSSSVQLASYVFPSSISSSFRNRLPSVWITRRVISNALDALTRNFSSLFTEVVDGKLSPSEEIKPFVNDLTTALRLTVHDKNLYLTSTSYPMANKLLLDSGDYETLRVMLNHTLYMAEVNSTRLYDFAARSLTRIQPIEAGLEVLLTLISDLCRTSYYRAAVGIFLQGVHRLSTHIVTLLSESSVAPYRGGILLKGGLLKPANYRPQIQPQVPINNASSNYRKAFVQRKELGLKLQNYSRILQTYFNKAKEIIGKEEFPSKAYKITAHIYKNAGMFQMMLELYKEAILDNAADKQLKNLVVYNLARSPDYWDAAIDILSEMEDKPDLFMYTSGILACETGGDWEHAIYLLDKLKKDGYNLTTVAVTSAIAACAAKGRADEALLLLEEMSSKHRLTANICTYNSVLSACAKAGRWREAFCVYEKMRNALEYSDMNNPAHTRNDESIDFLRAVGPQSNIFTYNTLIEALGAGDQHLLIDEVYRQAVMDGVFNPFLNITVGQVDLHNHSSHMAQAAMRLLFDLLLMAYKKSRSLENTQMLNSEGQMQLKSWFPGGKGKSDARSNDEEVEEDNALEAIFASIGHLLSPFIINEDTAKYSSTKLQGDIIIIVGKGQKLRDVVRTQLLKGFRPSLQAYVHKSNIGRLIVPKNSILEWLRVQGTQ